MRKIALLIGISGALALLSAGCSSSMNSTVNTPSQPGTPSSQTSVVSLSMTDDPPSGVNVLFFQVSLTDATLTPASGSPVSLLNNNTPVQIDVTQLQALSAFLSTVNVPAGTYNSLSLTFANPQLVIFNASDTSLGSTCAVDSICQLTPALSSSTVNLTSSPFPVAVAANNPLGFLVDFHLNTVIQPDLSVNLAAANGISIKQLPPPSTSVPPQLGWVTGTVENVNAANNQFTVLTSWGRTFTVAATSTTEYDSFPTSACSTAGFSCVAANQIVRLQIGGVATGGTLNAATVEYLQSVNQQTVVGTIVGIMNTTTSPTNSTIIRVVLHTNPGAASTLPLGGVANVTIPSDATFTIDVGGVTMPSGLTFTGTSSLFIGQTVQLIVEPSSVSASSAPSLMGGWGPPQTVSFTTSSVELEPSQLTGQIATLNTTADSFALGFNFSFASWPDAGSANTFTAVLANVDTTSQTTYDGFSPESFSGLATSQFVSVSGWLFSPSGLGASPTMVAQKVVMRPTLFF
jgi:hypothetical protein